jgi:hypothetical protein
MRQPCEVFDSIFVLLYQDRRDVADSLRTKCRLETSRIPTPTGRLKVKSPLSKTTSPVSVLLPTHFFQTPFARMVNWTLGELFLQDFGHQGSIKALWEQRWKFPCTLGVYPFHDGKFQDFEPIFKKLIEENINDPYEDAWCNAFLPTAQRLAQEADAAASTDTAQAIELYKRSCVVYRISRFPYIGTPLKREAFEAQKKAYLKCAALWDVPLQEVVIPHSHAGEGDGQAIPLYVRMPLDASPEKPCPVMLLVTGLDGHRPDNTEVRCPQYERVLFSEGFFL